MRVEQSFSSPTVRAEQSFSSLTLNTNQVFKVTQTFALVANFGTSTPGGASFNPIAIATGTGNAIILTFDTDPEIDCLIMFIPIASNTDVATVTIGSDTIPILSRLGNPLLASEIILNVPVFAHLKIGTSLQLIVS